MNIWFCRRGTIRSRRKSVRRGGRQGDGRRGGEGGINSRVGERGRETETEFEEEGSVGEESELVLF